MPKRGITNPAKPLRAAPIQPLPPEDSSVFLAAVPIAQVAIFQGIARRPDVVSVSLSAASWRRKKIKEIRKDMAQVWS